MKHPLILGLLLAAIAPAFAQDAKPIATVNGRGIHCVVREHDPVPTAGG